MSSKKSSKKQAAKSTEQRPAKRKKIVSLAQYESEAKGSATAANVGATGEKPAKPSTKTATATGENVGERGANGESQADGTQTMSLLDAAAHILSLGTGDPMRCKDIVDLAVARSLWTPRTGKTPASTLYAAILRELTTKGEACRFVKTERGKFALKDSQYIKEQQAKVAAGKEVK